MAAYQEFAFSRLLKFWSFVPTLIPNIRTKSSMSTAEKLMRDLDARHEDVWQWQPWFASPSLAPHHAALTRTDTHTCQNLSLRILLRSVPVDKQQ